MKRLLLLRHGKSDWGGARLDDFDRPLAPRGRRASLRMAEEIASRHWLPAAVLVSPALRTRETWKLVSPALPDAPEAAFPEALYLAPPERLLQLLRATPEDSASLLLVGHNPGLEELAAQLAGPGSDAGGLERLREKFPTAALAVLEFEGSWRALAPGTARLGHFLLPRELG